MNKQDIFNRLTQDREELEQYNVTSLSLFGSIVRGQENEESDVDILVSFGSPIGLFKFIDLKYHLEEILGKNVDLVTEQALHPRFHNKIIEDSIHIF